MQAHSCFSSSSHAVAVVPLRMGEAGLALPLSGVSGYLLVLLLLLSAGARMLLLPLLLPLRLVLLLELLLLTLLLLLLALLSAASVLELRSSASS